MQKNRHLIGNHPRWLFAPGLLAVLLAAPAAWHAQGTQPNPAPDSPAASTAQSGDPEIAVPLPKGKKLVLTNGTFQIVREYQRNGDRVRYYSLERSAWEEIPAALVDWDATQKAEAERQDEDKALVAKIRESDRAKRVADVDSDRSFEVRPGLILPDDAGLYALDGSKIQTMKQDHAEYHVDKGRTAERILTGVPLIKDKERTDIPGKHAKIRLQSADPEFYFRTADQRDPQIILLRTDIEGDQRLLETFTVDMVGQVNYKNQEYSTQEWDAAHGLYRFTLDQTLPPGEYALVEMTPQGHDPYVWDFGIDGAGGDAGAGGSKKK